MPHRPHLPAPHCLLWPVELIELLLHVLPPAAAVTLNTIPA
jgi:hypothetical protein